MGEAWPCVSNQAPHSAHKPIVMMIRKSWENCQWSTSKSMWSTSCETRSSSAITERRSKKPNPESTKTYRTTKPPKPSFKRQVCVCVCARACVCVRACECAQWKVSGFICIFKRVKEISGTMKACSNAPAYEKIPPTISGPYTLTHLDLWEFQPSALWGILGDWFAQSAFF